MRQWLRLSRYFVVELLNLVCIYARQYYECQNAKKYVGWKYAMDYFPKFRVFLAYFLKNIEHITQKLIKDQKTRR